MGRSKHLEWFGERDLRERQAPYVGQLISQSFAFGLAASSYNLYCKAAAFDRIDRALAPMPKQFRQLISNSVLVGDGLQRRAPSA